MATFIVPVSARGSAVVSRCAGQAPATSVAGGVRTGTPPGNGRGGHAGGEK
jgi:hypothetical protein